jgi:hydrogenase expression/formation protein HypC
MCLAVPMKIAEIRENGSALVSRDGLEAEVDLALVENPRVGDYVIVHAGYAIEVLDLQEAQERLELFRAMGEMGSDQ